MKQEWHVTVQGDPFQWRGWCIANGIKPLWIELNNFNRQLMCAITEKDMVDACIDPAIIAAGDVTPYTVDMAKAGFEILRVKHEVQAPHNIDIATHGTPVIYYECHLKYDGRFRPELKATSRDLFRDHRWYATKRSETPFDPIAFKDFVERIIAQRAHLDSFEYEACLFDSNPGLDHRWI